MGLDWTLAPAGHDRYRRFNAVRLGQLRSPAAAAEAEVCCHLWMLRAEALFISLQVLIAREQPHASAAPQKLLLRSVAKLRLEIPATIENALDEHRIRRDDERDSDAALESGHPQSWQQVIALCSSQWKCREPVAEIDDAADIAVRALLTRMRRDVFVQAVNVVLGKWREDNAHKVSLLLARGAACLDAP
jgi:hypothetical protein